MKQVLMDLLEIVRVYFTASFMIATTMVFIMKLFSYIKNSKIGYILGLLLILVTVYTEVYA